MTVTGIIAECNPFHEGHAYLIGKAREITGANYIVVALSGDYVQRGIPAVMSCEHRVRELLSNGADLIVSLPVYVSCSGADYFARGGVRLLACTGVVTDLVFGSESGDMPLLLDTAAALARAGADSAHFGKALRDAVRSGRTYAGALSDAAGGMPHAPNDLLGAHYLMALEKYECSIEPHAVKRIDCPSATVRREALFKMRRSGEAGDAPVISCDDLSGQLLHALIAAGDYSCFLDVSEDLSNRIRRLLPSFSTWSSFAALLKSRNLTYSHINRALLHILLGMRQNTMDRFDADYDLCGWIRPLGVRRRALGLLGEISGCAGVPLLDKLSAAGNKLSPQLYEIFQEEIRAELLYDISLSACNPKKDSPASAAAAFSKPIIIAD